MRFSFRSVSFGPAGMYPFLAEGNSLPLPDGGLAVEASVSNATLKKRLAGCTPDRLVTGSNAGYLQPTWGPGLVQSDLSNCKTDSRMEKLPKELSQLIDGLCRKGDQFAGMDQYDDAIEKYSEAWNLLPEPRDQWPAATWILISVGDAHFRLNEFAEGADILLDALHFPDGEDNPFLLLRLGQCLLELGRLDEAADALEEAYRRGGDELFADEDPKYLGFFKTQKKITPPGRTGRFNHPLG